MKSRETLEQELELIRKLEHEREVSDRLYAKKIVETAVFAIIGLITIGFFTAMIKFFITNPVK